MKRHILIGFKKGAPVLTKAGVYADLKAIVKEAQAKGSHPDFDELHLVESHHIWLNKAEATGQARAVVTWAKPETPAAQDEDPAEDEEPVPPKRKKK